MKLIALKPYRNQWILFLLKSNFLSSFTGEIRVMCGEEMKLRIPCCKRESIIGLVPHSVSQ